VPRRSPSDTANVDEHERAAFAESCANNGFDAEMHNWLSSEERSRAEPSRGRSLCPEHRSTLQLPWATGRALGGSPFEDQTQCVRRVRCDPLDPRKPSAMRLATACLRLRLEPLQLTVCDLGGDSPSRPGARGRSPSPLPFAPALAQSLRLSQACGQLLQMWALASSVGSTLSCNRLKYAPSLDKLDRPSCAAPRVWCACRARQGSIPRARRYRIHR
jgi:hypothetical protein